MLILFDVKTGHMADFYVIVTATRRPSRHRFECLTLPGEDSTSASTNRKSREQLPRQIRSVRPGQLHEETHQVAFTKRPWRASQLIGIEEFTRSDGQNRRFQKIRWSDSHPSENRQDRRVRIVSANQIILTVIQPL